MVYLFNNISQSNIVFWRHASLDNFLDIGSGKISKTPFTDNADEVIESDNLHVSIGWFDFRANFCDPGNEHKEDFTSGLKAAALGGFTGVVAMPDTYPTIDSKSGIEYVINKTANAIVNVYSAGCL